MILRKITNNKYYIYLKILPTLIQFPSSDIICSHVINKNSSHNFHNIWNAIIYELFAEYFSFYFLVAPAKIILINLLPTVGDFVGKKGNVKNKQII